MPLSATAEPFIPFSSLSINPPTPSSSPSLLVEVLIKIIKLALENVEVSSLRCQAKIDYAQVSRTWREASEVGVEYLVDETARAGRLAAYLRSTRRGGAVRRLEVYMWPQRMVGCSGLSNIVTACNRLQSFKLVVRRVGPKSEFLVSLAPFNLALEVALRGSKTLKSLTLDLGYTTVHYSFLYASLAEKEQLENLTIIGEANPDPRRWNKAPTDHDNDDFDFPSLRTITLDGVSADIANQLIGGGEHTLEAINMEQLDIGYDSKYTTLSRLSLGLKQLRSLYLPDAEWNTSDQMVEFSTPWIIANSPNLKEASIGVNCVVFKTDWMLLAEAKNLKHLSITCNSFSKVKKMRRIRQPDAVTFLSNAPVLRRLVLPRELIEVEGSNEAWWDDDMVRYTKEQALEFNNVVLDFAQGGS